MAYERVNWKDGVDGETPINAKNLNKMDKAIAEIYDLFHPVGTYYETSDINFDPNVTWGGEWELDEDGTVLVSKSSVEGSKFNDVVGTVLGEENHQLTKEELPQIDIRTYYAEPSTSGGSGNGLQYGARSGNSINTLVDNANFGEKAHNNIQPSKIVNRWHRIA